MAGGFVQVNRIDHVDNVGAYVVKYMLKDTEDPRLMGENAYLHSRGLNEPYEVTSWSSESSEFWSVARALQKNCPRTLPSTRASMLAKYAIVSTTSIGMMILSRNRENVNCDPSLYTGNKIENTR